TSGSRSFQPWRSNRYQSACGSKMPTFPHWHDTLIVSCLTAASNRSRIGFTSSRLMTRQMRTLVEHLCNRESSRRMKMDVQAISFRGFKLVARGVSQAAVDQARAEVEGVLEKHGVTAADLDNLTHRYRILGESGVDVQHLRAEDYKRFNIDP